MEKSVLNTVLNRISQLIFGENINLKLINPLTSCTLLLLFATLTFTSCTEAEPGPAGPIGQTGIRGEKGDTGEKGETGSANVTSFTFSKISFTNAGKVFELPALTAEILEKGLVVAYIRVSGGATWYPLPYEYFGSKINILSMAPGQITLSINYTGDGVDFRFVLIPGTTNVVMRSMSAAIDLTNYSAVKEYYNLPD
ncbi:MAG: collagen-like protein [Chryseolinea sp.]